MKGFILALRHAKDEDMIAMILTEHSIGNYYRFYGARHSILQLGNLIDFEVEGENSRFIPRLRGLSQMNFPWIYKRNRLSIWHDFIKLFDPHLRDAVDMDKFYYNLLLDAAKKWDKQNPKRIVCECYLNLLIHEGRLHPIDNCYICERPLGNQISLMSAFKPTHPDCIYSPAVDKKSFEKFLENKKTTYLDNNTVEQLYNIISKGL